MCASWQVTKETIKALIPVTCMHLIGAATRTSVLRFGGVAPTPRTHGTHLDCAQAFQHDGLTAHTRPCSVTHVHAGHVAGCASYNFSSISFMQIVKAAEPVVSVLTLSLLYGCAPARRRPHCSSGAAASAPPAAARTRTTRACPCVSRHAPRRPCCWRGGAFYRVSCTGCPARGDACALLRFCASAEVFC